MKKGYTLKVAIIVSLGGFLFGFDASVISGVIEFVQPQFDLSDIQTGWVVSSPTFAAILAMLTAGIISDYIGRKLVLINVALLYAVSALFSAIAPTYEILVIARMVGGLAFGAALVLAPIYIAEIAPADQRGKMVSIQQFNIVLGFSVSYFSNYLLLDQYQTGNLGLNEQNVWRWMLGLEFVPAIIYFALMFTVPRSPRWLLVKGKIEEAKQVLNRIFGSVRATQAYANLEYSLSTNTEASEPKIKLFSLKMKLVLTVGLIIGIIQQVTGVNAIYFYAPTIFEQSGVGTNAAFAQAVWVGIINVVFTIVAMLLIDKLGRRPLLFTGLLGVIISMGITAYGFNQSTYTLTDSKIQALPDGIEIPKLNEFKNKTYESDVSFKNELKTALGSSVYARYEGDLIKNSIKMNPVLILVGILLFVASFAISLGPVMWVLLSEIFPNRIRGLAIAVVGFVNSGSSFLVQLVFPWELSNLGNATTFMLFGIFGILGFVSLYKILPETKGKSLEELESELLR